MMFLTQGLTKEGIVNDKSWEVATKRKRERMA